MDDDDPPPRNESMKRNPPPLSWIQKLVATVQSDCVPSAVAGLLVGFVVAYLVRRRQGRIGFRGVPSHTAAQETAAQEIDGAQAAPENGKEGGFNDPGAQILQSFVTGATTSCIFC